jgi:hypothetical protein
MGPIAISLCNVLLDHHREVCMTHTLRPPIIDRCLITYGDLCERAGYPDLPRGVGRHLQEVAEWCQANNWPPLNSLAVNRDTRMPGDSYDVAPGCSLLGWPSQAEACIVFQDYPEDVS